ncbi:MAG TPA: ribonuclease P protein component [bacterium]|jgi:ribonuclease P protein component|nr:ribonuclease P protein component [bacterium]HOA18579.1 ribonuclease P protein component [bacterium]
MLNKKNRLVSKFQFNVSRKYGFYLETPYSHIYSLKANNYEGPPKIGIVISNKFSKKAVKRNRTRRLYREAIRNNIDRIGKGYWIVIHPKADCLGKKYEEINSDINKAIQKISFTD